MVQEPGVVPVESKLVVTVSRLVGPTVEGVNVPPQVELNVKNQSAELLPGVAVAVIPVTTVPWVIVDGTPLNVTVGTVVIQPTSPITKATTMRLNPLFSGAVIYRTSF